MIPIPFPTPESQPTSEKCESFTQPLWSSLRRFIFRFLFCYIMLFGTFCIQFMISVPWYYLTGKFVSFPLDPLWRVIVPWVARHALHFSKEISYAVADQGDTLSDYIVLLASVVLALISTGVWSVLDRRRTNYARLEQWLRLVMQCLLAGILFSYGFDKVFPVQFGNMTPGQMMARLGELPPMDLLWALMAASKPYTIFSGLLEVSAGILLLIPRLRFLGATLAIIVLTNIFALNLAYDVSVKSLSLQYLLMAIYLAAPECPNLVSLLILSQPVAPKPEVALSNKLAVTRWAWIVQGVAGLLSFLLAFAGGAQAYAKSVARSTSSPFIGVWKVVDFGVSGDPHRSPLTNKLAAKLQLSSGDQRWKKLVFEPWGSLVIEYPNGELQHARLKLQSDNAHGELSDGSDKTWNGHLSLERAGPKSLALQGNVNGVELSAKLRSDVPLFPLTSGPYHIVQDW